MSTAKEIISEIANDKEYYALCRQLSPTLYDDLFQELMLILLEYDKEKLTAIYARKQIKFFIVKILLNQAKSSTSPFYKKYRNPNKEIHYDKKFHTDIPDISYDSITAIYSLIDNSEEIITDELINSTYSTIELYSSADENNWYRAELFKQYLKEGNIRALSKKTQIPVMSIQRSLKEFKRDIKHMVYENTFNTPI